MNRQRIRSSTLLAVITLALGVGLSTARSLAADRVRISYTAPGPQHGLLWLGDTAGLFKKNNLDVEIIYMPGNISAPSLMSGEIQFGQMTGALMSPIRLQGGDPVMLVSVQELLDDRLVVRPNIKSAGGSQRQTHRDLALRRRVAHARAQHAAALRPQRKRCDFSTDRRYAGADHRHERQLGRCLELLAARSSRGAAGGHEDSAQHGRAEYFLSRHRAGDDATLYRQESRRGQAHGEELRRSDPHRQNQSRSHQAGLRQIPQDQRREATGRRLSDAARNR